MSFDINTWAYGRVRGLSAVTLYGTRLLLVKQDREVFSKKGDKERKVIRAGHLLLPRRPICGGLPRYVHYKSIYDAIRSCIYALAGYGGREEGEVQAINISILNISWLIKMLSLYSNLSKEERQAIKQEFAKLVARFEKARSLYKRTAYEKLDMAKDLRDKLERINLGATMARSVSAERHLELRLQEVRQILPHMNARLAALFALQDRSLDILWETRNSLLSIINSPWMISGSEPTTREYLATKVTFERLKEWLQLLEVEPYLAMRDLTVGDIWRALGALRRKMTKEAKEELLRALNGVRTKLAGAYLEKIHLELCLMVKFLENKARFDREGLRLTLRDSKKLAQVLQSFVALLEELDDTRFQRPVLVEARNRLVVAVDLLKKQNPQRIITAKEIVEEAQRVL